jgi:hypothetical protein
MNAERGAEESFLTNSDKLILERQLGYVCACGVIRRVDPVLINDPRSTGKPRVRITNRYPSLPDFNKPATHSAAHIRKSLGSLASLSNLTDIAKDAQSIKSGN